MSTTATMPEVASKGITNIARIAANSAKTAALATANKTSNFFKDIIDKQGPVVIFILAVILVFVIVIIYITFALKNSNLSGKILTKSPIKLDSLAVPFEVSASDIPKPSVGREFGYSFWLYIDKFEQTPGNNKLIFYRGTKDDLSMANPLVMMDGVENKLYLAIKTQDNTLTGLTTTGSTAADLTKVIKNNYFKNVDYHGTDVNKYVIMEVDYVPLQRWVNFSMIIDNKIVTLFMDGEIYSVKSTDELKALRKPELDNAGNKINYNLIIDRTDGGIYVGKNSINNKVTVNGYLSTLAFYNYAMSLNEVKYIYNRGPLVGNGWLQKLGIGYGVRSPVYKINADINN